jgi:putative peptidoglycan lipid II flippase
MECVAAHVGWVSASGADYDRSVWGAPARRGLAQRALRFQSTNMDPHFPKAAALARNPIGVTRLRSLYHGWISWAELSANRRIFSAALTVGALTLLVKAAAAGKDIFVARVFGLGDALDSFLMAYVIPAFAISVIAGSIYTAFVPVLVRVRETQGHADAKRLFANISFLAFVALTIVTVVLALSDKWLLRHLASGFEPSKLATTISLFEEMLPLILIGGMAFFCGAVLNSQNRFALAALAPILTPLAIVFALLVSGSGRDPHTLAFGTLCGSFCELCVVVWGLNKAGYLAVPKWHRMDESTRKVVSQYLPMVAGALIMSSTTVVDQLMATWLPAGSVSALNYGSKIATLGTGLAATALGTAALPYLSELVARRDVVGLRHTFRTYAKIILWTSIPLTVLGIVFSRQIVELLFQRGAFDAAATTTVTRVQQLFLLQIPFYILGILSVRMISSLSGNHVLGWIALSSFGSNLAGNYLLMPRLGVAGIALSTSIVYLGSTTICVVVVMKMLRKLETETGLNAHARPQPGDRPS